MRSAALVVALAAAGWLAACSGGVVEPESSGGPPDVGIPDASPDTALGDADGGGLLDADAAPDGQDADAAPDGPDADTADAEVSADTEVAADTGPDEVTPPACPGAFGCACDTGADCFSGYCIVGPEGKICTKTCDESCPPGYGCRQLASGGTDLVFVCVPDQLLYCAPCEKDGDCVHPLTPDVAGLCLDAGDGSGSFCATGCSSDASCLAGAACETVEAGAGPVAVCRPVSGVCDLCTFPATATGASTSCSVTNDAGTCTGTRECSADGLSACDAPAPFAEECNGADDDCDGQTDETFPDAGLPCDGDDADACETGKLACTGGQVVCNEAPGGAKDEICNGVDDDCDGETDETFPELGLPCDGADADACLDGQWVCGAGTGLVCDDDAEGAVELCNGVDDDCDGLEDGADPDLVTVPCEDQDGACAGATKPASLCVGGAWAPCGQAAYAAASAAYQAGVEASCDGVDNDCDGLTDEDLVGEGLAGDPLTGVGAPCGGGGCAGGVTVCNAAGDGVVCDSELAPGAEVCDGVDNDCDGLTDGLDTDLVLVPCDLQEGVCAGATRPASLCQGGAWKACPAVFYSALDPAYEDGVEVACDGLDNDCDGETDEDFALELPSGQVAVGVGAACGAGACGGGTTVCNEAGDGLVCTTSIQVGAEVCNGKDDDCDGKTDAEDDDLVLVPCDKQAGVCAGATKPAARCVAGAWQACEPGDYAAASAAYEHGAEVSCDGADNDCDGAPDDDFTVSTPDGATVAGAGKACGVGLCAGGVTECNAAGDGLVCPSVANVGAEVCDGEDNDCDGKTDGADPSLALVKCDNQQGVCFGATRPASRCVGGGWEPCVPADYAKWTPLHEPGAEVSCDGQDNDCDGTADEDFSVTTPDGKTVKGVGKSCGAGSCQGGQTVCTADGTGVECSTDAPPAAEVCDGEDNDCDGKTDSADPDLELAPCANQEGVCAGSTRPPSFCVGGAWLPCGSAVYSGYSLDFEAVTEKSCDGLDNDCDGKTDEDFAVKTLAGVTLTGVGKNCGSGACSGGLTACDAAGTGLVCSTEGKAKPEVCDAVDNDCDGQTDAADPGLLLAYCDNQQGVCAGAVRPASLCAVGEWKPCGPDEYGGSSSAWQAGVETSCDGKDNDCDGAVDEDFTLKLLDGATVTGVDAACGVGECAGGVTFCNASKTGILCSTEAGASAEICDGKDNDCDGAVDAFDPTLVLAPCEKTQGVCSGALHPALLCVGGDWQACPDVVYGLASGAYQAGVESACDGKDNDCDGGVDEDFTVGLPDGSTAGGIGAACGVGLCSGGLTQCNASKTGVVCSSAGNAKAELCNGQDDDCDGKTDAADADLQPVPCDKQAGPCAGTTRPPSLCVGGGWSPCPASLYEAASASYEDGAEASCDGVDNDCDGKTDDDFTLVLLDGKAVSGAGKPCGVGACAGGLTACNDAGDGLVCPTEETAPAPEVCDGVDNDCDGFKDAKDDDLLTVLCEDQDGVCAGAMKPPALCTAAGWVPCGPGEYAAHATTFQAGAEASCDGLDNDCDTQTDEGFTFTDYNGAKRPVGEPCGTGLCAGGVVVCAGPSATACSEAGNATPETCDDVDEDCDGQTDEGCDDDGDDVCDDALPVFGAPAVCPAGGGDCNDQSAAVKPGAPELCNLVDDDCDGQTDEAFTGCPAASCQGSGDAWFQTAAASCQAGQCLTANPIPCGKYTCAGGGAAGTVCATSCTTDATCVASAHCVEATGTCVDDVPNGGACVEPSDCVSGHCQNGFCCAAGDCCAQPASCPAAYEAAATCDDPTTCQGTRNDAACVDNVCQLGPDVDDDSACGPAVQALDCSPLQPVTCTGATNQVAPVCSDSCVEDVDCIGGFHCDGTCQPDKGDGQSCDEDSDCASDYCQNGFCCASGDCCDVAASCPADYAEPPVCDDPATCQGTRVVAVCEGSTCGSTVAQDDSACGPTLEANACGPYDSLLCNGAVQQNIPQCPQFCSGDGDCDDNAHCDGVCVPDQVDGSPCDEASDCVSGYCEGGICCAGGFCCNAPADCPPSFTSAPACDFPSTCQGTKDVAVCVSHVCATQVDVADDSACTTSVVAKDCGAYPSVDCKGGAAQTEPACATACSSDSKCDPDAYCDGSDFKCKPDLGDGNACNRHAQCTSGHCQNGFCCATGDCCATAASCAAAAYSQPSACVDVPNCQGERRDAVCSQSMCALGPPVGDDTGCSGLEASTCGAYPSAFCGPFVIQSAPPCLDFCVSDAQCDPGAFCSGGQCVPQLGAGVPCTTTSQCAGGLVCVDGVCCTSSCGGLCQRCDLPGSLGSCAPIPDGADPDGECGGVSCAGWYGGFAGDLCYRKADVGPAAVACNGGGACQQASELCPLQPSGTSLQVACNAQCQDPVGGTCAGQIPGVCANVDPGLQTCGVGECARTAPQCVNGGPAPCAPGTPSLEICDGKDNDCDGLTDAADPDLALNQAPPCENQNGICGGATKPPERCVAGTWQACQAADYQSWNLEYEPGTEQSCDGLDNDCDGVPDDDFDDDVLNCGGCGLPCTNAHGATYCNGGFCTPVCDPGYASCDFDARNGCETALTSVTHCGGCFQTCDLPNANESCSTQQCKIGSCATGWCNRNGVTDDGCEFLLATVPICGSTYTNLGSVRGDTGSDQIIWGDGANEVGLGEKWFRVSVSEAVAPGDDDLKVRIELFYDGATNYDLQARCDGCTQEIAGESNGTSGGYESLIIRWDDDDCFLFGCDSGRDVYFKVDYKSANVCSQWVAYVTGNPGGGVRNCTPK